MINRLKRTSQRFTGTGETTGFSTVDPQGAIVADFGAAASRKKPVSFDHADICNQFNVRKRFTIAEVNAGATILPAKAKLKYRLIRATAISVGGAAGAVTTVDILGTLSSSRKLVAYAQASLTQSAVLKDGGTGAAVLADGASYTANDANTAITIGKTGADVTTATHIDINLTFAVEHA